MLNIVNYYERLVIDQLWKLTSSAEQPMTQAFQEDVACLALNRLPSCYVRNTIDKGLNVNEQQYLEMVRQVDEAIAQAITQVSLRPRLDRDN